MRQVFTGWGVAVKRKAESVLLTILCRKNNIGM